MQETHGTHVGHMWDIPGKLSFRGGPVSHCTERTPMGLASHVSCGHKSSKNKSLNYE